MIFDSHAHYDASAFQEDMADVLSSLFQGNIAGVVNTADCLASAYRCLKLADTWSGVYAALGVHPEHAADYSPETEAELKKLFSHPKALAVGEIGLDYYWQKDNAEIQKSCFLSQLMLAKELGKPVVIHSRDAAADTVEILEKEYGCAPAYIHCYSYSKEIAQRLLPLGYMFGVGGVVTFKNARKLVETVEILPLDRILLETDSPYLAPVPFRGERNDSLKLSHVVSAIAQIKGITPQEVEAVTLENAHRFFGIS